MQVERRCAVNAGDQAASSCCCAQPGGDVAAFCAGSAWHLCDWRTGNVTTQRQKAHSLSIQAVDIAPSAPHMLATASQDSTVKVWDCRCGLRLADTEQCSRRFCAVDACANVLALKHVQTVSAFVLDNTTVPLHVKGRKHCHKACSFSGGMTIRLGRCPQNLRKDSAMHQLESNALAELGRRQRR